MQNSIFIANKNSLARHKLSIEEPIARLLDTNIFSIEIQSNDLSYHQEYSKRQEIVYQLIKHLHEKEELGYRKISQKLDSWGVKTQRGKQWFNTSVSSVLKKKRLQNERVESIRNQVFEPVISKMRVKYYTFD